MPAATPAIPRQILAELAAMLELPAYDAFDSRARVVVRGDGLALAVLSDGAPSDRTPAFRITVRALADGLRVAMRQRGLGDDAHRQCVVGPEADAAFWKALEYMEDERGRWGLCHSRADD